MYEFTSHHKTADADLEARMKSAFDAVADAPNASPATFSVVHEDGGHQTFTARFENLEEARSFRSALAADPEADAHRTPRLEELQPETPPRIEPDWSEPAPEATAP